MVAKKKEPTFAAQSEQRIAEDGSFPHSVEPPVRARWERALTEKYGKRGKAWTTTKSEPQWMVRFRDGDAAVWFKKTGQRKSSGAAPKRIVSADFRPRAAQRGFWRRPPPDHVTLWFGGAKCSKSCSANSGKSFRRKLSVGCPPRLRRWTVSRLRLDRPIISFILRVA
jgi:hypothetical protein